MPVPLLRLATAVDVGAVAIVAVSIVAVGLPAAGATPPPNPRVVDLATLGSDDLYRVHGSLGEGTFGVPVAGGFDIDGDGLADTAIGAMTASPLGRNFAGAVFLTFGDGARQGTVDTAVVQAGVLRIAGADQRSTDTLGEHTGSEVWMDDLDGDGLGDLIICRQDHTPPGRTGAGAVTILFGDSAVRTFAATAAASDSWLDLTSPPVGLQLTTILGRSAGDRLCIWARTGDVDGDGVADLLVGADKRNLDGAHNGVAYVVRGGSHLTSAALFDLADFGEASFGLDHHVAEILPPSSSSEYHFGATVTVADLDANGRAEALIAATINRAGASLAPAGGFGHGNSGAPSGRLYIAWDNLFPAAPWATGFSLAIDSVPASRTEIRGTNLAEGTSSKFGEELLGGLDFDRDGHADLFVGDITGSAPNRGSSGLGHVFWEARLLKGQSFDLGSLPAGVEKTTLYGPSAGAIGGDTATQGDFDGDGVADLAMCSPCDSPLGRNDAGTAHVLYGSRTGRWPALIDLAPGNLPEASLVEIAAVYGAKAGDVLCYSAARGDHDGDGRADLIVNEMKGDGTAVNDVGNLIVVGGDLLDRGIVLFRDGFGSGDASSWTVVKPAAEPPPPLGATGSARESASARPRLPRPAPPPATPRSPPR
ncbi:MAG TPA: hypothetical protein VMV46_17140 [Thermoanaerobaculia bacterium]|nr:hypothetical protein [Thermoanaerobaculia bacterium]